MRGEPGKIVTQITVISPPVYVPVPVKVECGHGDSVRLSVTSSLPTCQ